MDARLKFKTSIATAMENATAGAKWEDDCSTIWSANIVRDVLGVDPAVAWRGRYKTRRGAVRALGKGGLLAELRRAARRYKWKRIDPEMARPGDVGLAWTEYEGKPTLATVICHATGRFVGRSELGFTSVPASMVMAAWGVLPDHALGSRVSLPRIGKPWQVPMSEAVHEPVSTFIGLTALLTGTGLSAGAAGLVGGFIVSTAISVGLSLAAAALQPHKGIGLDSSLADTSQAASVQVTERQAIPFKRVIVGSAFVGGALFFEQVKPPYLTMGVLLNYGEISGVDKTFIGTNQISYSGAITDNAIQTPRAVTDQPNYPARMRFCYRFGTDAQTRDALIHDRFANIDTDFRQRGIATYVGEYHFGADQDEFVTLWGQVARPNAYHVVRGVPVYDSRDPTQDINDETTWKGSNNASLVQAWYLTRSYGGRIPMSRMDWDKIADSADYDDAKIGTVSGELISRHTIDGVISLNQRPFEVMQKLLTANAGLVLESGGKVWVSSSRPRTPVATIHDGILTGAFKYQGAKAKRDLVNKLQVRFVSPDQDYQLVDGPILSRTDLQDADGEVLPATLALEYTQDHRRAQRIQKMFLARSRLGRTVTCTVDLSLLAIAKDELIGNVVTLNSELFSVANGNYMVALVGLADDMTSVALSLVEYDSSVDTDWNPETDEQPFEIADIDTD